MCSGGGLEEQPDCMNKSRGSAAAQQGLWGSQDLLFLNKISKLFTYWEGMACFVVVRLSSGGTLANAVCLFDVQIPNLLSNGI